MLRCLFLSFTCIAFMTPVVIGQSSEKARKGLVDGFLTTWLVRKNIVGTKTFFDKKALKRGKVLHSWDMDDESIESLNSFLRGLAKQHHEKSFKKILFLRSKDAPEVSDSIFKKLSGGIINDPKRDRYILARPSTLISLGDDIKGWTRGYDLRGGFWSVIQIRILNENPRYGDDVAMAILWIKRGHTWRIALMVVFGGDST